MSYVKPSTLCAVAVLPGVGSGEDPVQASKAAVMEIKGTQNYSERLSAVSHFTTTVAHRLNDSLTPIICYSQLLSQSENRPEHQKRLEKILVAAFKAKEVLDGILAFAGEHQLHQQDTDLNQVVRQMILVARDMLGVDPEKIHLELSDEIQQFKADSHQLSQALLHLIRNAFQALSDEKGSITIRTLVTGENHYAVEVEDSGCGIPAKILPKVLLPFFTTKNGDSAGLGLSIVHSIVEAHEAELMIRSEEGRGTVVRIIFPVAH